MRDVPTNSAWVASITRAAERDEQRRTNPMTTASDTKHDDEDEDEPMRVPLLLLRQASNDGLYLRRLVLPLYQGG